MNLLKKYKNAVIAIASVAAVYAVMRLLGITCPIKFVTGVSCPGCGMTRACLSALRLDFADAFYYHPLWIGLIPASVALLYLHQKRRNKAFEVALAIIGVIMISVYLYRMINGGSDVVVFELKNGIVYRVFNALKNKLL